MVPITAAEGCRNAPVASHRRRYCRPFGKEDAPFGRANGASDGFEVEIRGGPDRIRTGDLQRDRLACWAATPRVRANEGGGYQTFRGILAAPCRSSTCVPTPS